MWSLVDLGVEMVRNLFVILSFKSVSWDEFANFNFKRKQNSASLKNLESKWKWIDPVSDIGFWREQGAYLRESERSILREQSLYLSRIKAREWVKTW